MVTRSLHRQSAGAGFSWKRFAATIFFVSMIALSCQAQDPVVNAPFVEKAIIAAELSLLAQEDDPTNPDAGIYTFFSSVQDEGDNLAIVAKNDGVCYAAYRGRVPGFFEDLIQRFLALFTFNFDFLDDVCSGSDCCKIRTPTQQDFDSLKDDVEMMVDMCRETCGVSTPCPLVLTGHHQGQ